MRHKTNTDGDRDRSGREAEDEVKSLIIKESIETVKQQ